MKKVILLFISLSTFVLSAQNVTSDKQKNRKELRTDYTPEQRAELRAKQMTLDLNLDGSQQKRVTQLFLEIEKEQPTISKKRAEMSKNEKFEFKNAMLDRRIEMKKGLKEILNEDQFQKWEESNHRKSSHFRKKSIRNKRNRQ